MGKCGRGGRPVVGGAPAVTQLGSVESAPAGGASGESCALWGADAVCRGRGRWRPGT